MQIELSDKEIKSLRHLRNALAIKVVPIDKLESFLEGLEQRVSAPASPGKRRSRKSDLKEKYRMQIIHKKIV